MHEETKQPGPGAAQTSHPMHHRVALFQHSPHPHQPRNVNEVQKEEQATAGLNTRIAIGLTNGVGTMWTAYTFAVIAVVGLFAILGVFSPVVALLVAWASQTLIQLVLLPVIMVGQNVLGHKAELQSEEQFRTTMSTYHDIEQIMQHLSAQDAELLKQSHMIIHLLKASGIPLEQLMAIQNNGDVATTEVQAQG
ncbi:MAG: hypothetical protein ACRDIV_23820 [Ktedonobacteraceae bacterium]